MIMANLRPGKKKTASEQEEEK